MEKKRKKTEIIIQRIETKNVPWQNKTENKQTNKILVSGYWKNENDDDDDDRTEFLKKSWWKTHTKNDDGDHIFLKHDKISNFHM